MIQRLLQMTATIRAIELLTTALNWVKERITDLKESVSSHCPGCTCPGKEPPRL